MDHPYYSVTVANLTRGWSYTTVEGEEWDPADDVVLVSPLTLTWGFEGEQVPGQLEPCAATVNLVARTARDVPPMELGDLVTVEVRVGSSGPRITAQPAMRVTSIDVELGPTGQYVALARITLVDLSADLRQYFPQPYLPPGAVEPRAHGRWRPRFAQLAVALGYSIGAPDWWDVDERPLSLANAPSSGPSFVTGLAEYIGWVWKDNAAVLLAQLLNSHLPDGYTHTLTPGYFATPDAYPAGWAKVAPSDDDYWSQLFDNSIGGFPLADPGTSYRFYLVPASRSTDTTELPLVLELGGDGILVVVPNTTTSLGHSRSALDAGWCDIPAKARRSREHVITAAKLNGQERYFADETPLGLPVRRDTFREFSTGAGIATREVATQLDMGDAVDSFTLQDPHFESAEAPYVALEFLTDASVSAEPWTYDAFTVHSSRMPQDLAEEILPKLAPRTPGETDGDGHVLRHITVARLAAGKRFGDGLVSGFITTGQMTIAGGDIVWTLTTTPGQPRVDTPPTPITVDEFTTAWGTLLPGETDLQVGDLAYVDA